MQALHWTFVALGILCCVGTGFAKDVIILRSESGNVIFTHKKHQEAVKDCTTCHKTAPGSIKESGQYRPHKLCIGCHENRKSGPVNCVDCHKASGS
ncbi:MAG TPA: cytochrome c3 family protein [Geobacteraceae bacterium]|nr:cytochrome c3 family protein [Geobacteraceae bacterium]